MGTKYDSHSIIYLTTVHYDYSRILAPNDAVKEPFGQKSVVEEVDAMQFEVEAFKVVLDGDAMFRQKKSRYM